MDSWTPILGYIAAFLTTFAYLPQAVKVIRSRNTAHLSLPMYIMMCGGILCWAAYGLAKNDWPIAAANMVTLCLALPILVMKIRHG